MTLLGERRGLHGATAAERPGEGEAIGRATTPAHDPADEWDLRQFLVALWWGRWLTAACLLIGLAVAGWALRTAEPEYRARMVVMPAPNTLGAVLGGGDASGFADVLRGQLLGGRAGAGLFDQFELIMRSQTLAQRLIDHYDFLKVVFAERWDARASAWKPPTGTRFDLSQRVKGWLGLPLWTPPTVETLADYLQDKIEIKRVNGTDFREIVLIGGDPERVAEIVRRAFTEADQLLKERDLDLINANLAYLRNQLARTTVTDYRAALVQMIASEEKSMMLLTSQLPYTFRILEPLKQPNGPERLPVRSFILAGAGSGLLIGIVLTLIRFMVSSAFSGSRRNAP